MPLLNPGSLRSDAIAVGTGAVRHAFFKTDLTGVVVIGDAAG